MITTNIPVRTINDLSTVPRQVLPQDMVGLKDAKVPVGNLPIGVYGESFNLDVLSRVLGYFITSPDGAGVGKGDLADLVNQETVRAKQEENLLRQGIASTAYGSGKAYTTWVAAYADAANIPANTPVVITNDLEAWRNGLHTWDGSNLNKSSFDYFEMAKNYVNTYYSTPDKRLLAEITALKTIVGNLTAGNANKYLFAQRGRYYKTGASDVDGGFDVYSGNYMNTGLIFLRAGAQIKVRVLQQNKGNFADVSCLLVLNTNLEKIIDLSQANITEWDTEEMDYEYTATQNCYVVATTIRFEGSGFLGYATVENNGTYFDQFNYRSAYDAYLQRQIAEVRYSQAKRLMTERGKLRFEFNERGRIYPLEEQSIRSDLGYTDLIYGGDIYTLAYRTTGLIPMEVGDYIKATVLNPNSNIQAMAILNTNLEVIRTEKATFEETGIAGDSYPWTYEYQAEERTYVKFCTINPANRGYVSDVDLCAELTVAGVDTQSPHIRQTEDIIVRESNITKSIEDKVEEHLKFLGPGWGYKAQWGVQFTEEVSPEHWHLYTGTGFIPLNVGDTLDIVVDANEQGGEMSVLNLYDTNKNFIRCVKSIPDFGAQGLGYKAYLFYESKIDGFATITSIHRPGWSYPYAIKNLKSRMTKLFNPKSEAYVTDTLVMLPKPTSLIQIDFFMHESLPPGTKQEGAFNCDIKVNCEGVIFESKAKFAVQGSSSAAYPKKNWSFDFFTDATFKTELAVKLGDLIPQTQLVWKANYIDATHARNILCNRLWEEMVQTRDTFPKREVDVAYLNQPGVGSLDTGAIGHVDGYPCVVNLNGQFYGIGSLNIGKKRDNYNLNKDNKKHVQFELLGGGINFVAEVPPYDKLGLRNPKLKNYEEGNLITDPEVAGAIQRLWDFHRLPLEERKAKFDEYYDRVNVTDWYLLVTFTAAADLLDKNSIPTTWDGKKWYWMPYDLDTTFGIHWAGGGLGYDSNWDWDGNNIIPVIKPVLLDQIIKRYADLRNNDVFTLSTVYRIERDLESKYSKELFKKEQERWVDIPSKNFGGIHQIMSWLDERIKFLDAKFNYFADGVLGQKHWNPPTLAAGASQTTTITVPGITAGTAVKADFGKPLQGTTMTAAVTSNNTVTITHQNPTAASVDLDFHALRVLKA